MLLEAQSILLNVSKGLVFQHEVIIAQLNRPTKISDENVAFIALESLHSIDTKTLLSHQFDIVIILRKYKLLPIYQQLYSHAKLFVWVHNFQTYDILGSRHRIIDTNAQAMCVSQCHQEPSYKVINGGFHGFFDC